ncbi:unnamed protein product [Moneuplotes crassus]|uniref:Secretory carrier membrane protein n=1 Tax=Euplotes crassus TaxID=5936 RepID=A0AAD1XU65_EUPCR|nr:unnamed protein product [Moneuplotes crassus]
MKYIGKAAIGRAERQAKYQVSNIRDNVEGALGGGRKVDLDWKDFNYPPLLKLFHYSTSRLKNPVLRFMRILHINFLMYILGICPLNFLGNIVISASGAGAGVNVFYSLLNILVFGAFALFVFYSGFYGNIRKPPGYHLLAYRIGQGVQCTLYFTFSILALGPFNGWAQISSLGGSGGEGFAIFLCVIESLLYSVITISGGLCLYLSFAYFEEDPFKDEIQENDTNVRV